MECQCEEECAGRDVTLDYIHVQNVERIADAVEMLALVAGIFLVRKALDWLNDE